MSDLDISQITRTPAALQAATALKVASLSCVKPSKRTVLVLRRISVRVIFPIDFPFLQGLFHQVNHRETENKL